MNYTHKTKVLLSAIGLFSLTGHLNAGQIALSFDDAPNYNGLKFTGEERTNRLIEAMRTEGVAEAIFFCNSDKLNHDKGRQRLYSYADAGHLIANHAYSHVNLNESKVEDYIELIRKGDQDLQSFPRFTRFFRYPYSKEGSTKAIQKQVRKALDEMGYESGYFTIDGSDWYMQTVYYNALVQHKTIDYVKLKAAYLDLTWKSIEFYDRLSHKALHREVKHIILLHETDLNALFLKDLIVLIKSKGWTIIPASEAYQDPIANKIPKRHVTQFRITSLALDNDYRQEVESPSADPKVIDKAFAEAFK